MTSKVRHILTYILFIVLLSGTAFSQNHPELEWFTFESEHFVFHYHSGTEKSAEMVLTISEEVYPIITGLYHWEPSEKTHIIIQDTDDYANGGAYYFDNKILIWASPLEFELRGNHNWMRNVFSHEFSHIVSLGASMSFPINIPAGFIQILNREKPLRDNIILEYPRGIAAIPVANTVVPMWFAEGMAQYQFDKSPHDTWDSFRDMLLRDQSLNGKLLSLSQASYFGKRGVGNESVYNTGFSFVQHLADTYTPDILRKLTAQSSKITNWSVEKAFKTITGNSLESEYRRWQKSITKEYQKRTEIISENLKQGERIFDEGPSNFFPSWSPDGSAYVFAGSKGNDYISQTNLYLFKDGETEKIAGRTRGNIAWNSTGTKLYYAGRAKPNIYGSTWFDLMEYDLKTEKETRLTREARLYSVDLDDNDNIYVIRVHDGSHNIFSYDPGNGKFKALTHYTDGEQVFTLQVDSKQNRIIYDLAITHGRDIYSLDLESGRTRAIAINTNYDNRSPNLSVNGDYLVYSSDRSGIFNIYKKNLETGEETILSNVLGAALYPNINPKTGDILYTLYEDGRFLLSEIKAELPDVLLENTAYKEYTLIEAPYTPKALQSFDSKPYTPVFSKMFFMPYAFVDYGKVKLGTVMYQSEILNKFNLTASGAINSIFDMDVYSRLDYNKLLPNLYLEAYYVTYHLDTKSTRVYDYYAEDNTFTFSLWETITGANYQWDNHYFGLSASYGEYSAKINTKQITVNPLMYTFGYTYFKGSRLEFDYRSDFLSRDWQADINPRKGFVYDIKLAYDLNQFINDFGINEEFGTFSEKYANHNTFRTELEMSAYLPAPLLETAAFGWSVSAGYLENSKIDSFFHYFGGGLPGLKGYPFYTIEGTQKVVNTVMFRFPLVKQMDIKLHPFTFNRIYLSLYHQMGDAWRGDLSDIQIKQDVGMELRIGGHSYYAYPLAIILDAVYGLDEFKSYDKMVGKDWRFYWKILFEF